MNAWVRAAVNTDRTRHGLCRVLPPARHVGREGEQDRPRCHGAQLLPTDAPWGLPQSDRPTLHFILLRRGRLLWRHQLGWRRGLRADPQPAGGPEPRPARCTYTRSPPTMLTAMSMYTRQQCEGCFNLIFKMLYLFIFKLNDWSWFFFLD